jgi:hypothetical protein
MRHAHHFPPVDVQSVSGALLLLAALFTRSAEEVGDVIKIRLYDKAFSPVAAAASGKLAPFAC